MKHAVYAGANNDLNGKTALVRPYQENAHLCQAQFDDTKCQFAYGWHIFRVTDFNSIDEGGAP